MPNAVLTFGPSSPSTQDFENTRNLLITLNTTIGLINVGVDKWSSLIEFLKTIGKITGLTGLAY